MQSHFCNRSSDTPSDRPSRGQLSSLSHLQVCWVPRSRGPDFVHFSHLSGGGCCLPAALSWQQAPLDHNSPEARQVAFPQQASLILQMPLLRGKPVPFLLLALSALPRARPVATCARLSTAAESRTPGPWPGTGSAVAPAGGERGGHEEPKPSPLIGES